MTRKISLVYDYIFIGTLFCSGVLANGIGEMQSQIAIFLGGLFFLLFHTAQCAMRMSQYRIVILFIMTYSTYSILLVVVGEQMLAQLIFLYPYLLMLILFSRRSDFSVEGFRNVEKVIFWFAIMTSFVAALQKYLPQSSISDFVTFRTDSRPFGLSRSTLEFSGFLVIAVSYFVHSHVNITRKYLFFGIAFLGIAVSGSRGAMLGYLVAIFIMFMKEKKLFSFLLIGLVCVFIPSIFRRFLTTFDFDEASNLQRISIYSNFFEDIEIYGAGVGATSPAASRLYPSTGFESSLLNIAYEQGLALFFVFSLVIVISFLSISKHRRNRVLQFLLPIMPLFIFQQNLLIPSVFIFFSVSLLLTIGSPIPREVR